MLSLPVYLRAGVYYLHTRIAGKQIKRSLNTTDRAEAISRAVALLEALGRLKPVSSPFDMNKIRRFEIDLGRGILKADGAEDHQRMMEALSVLKTLGIGQQATPVQQPSQPMPNRITLIQLASNFFLLKSHLKPATKLSYEKTAAEFSEFVKHTHIMMVRHTDVTRFQEHLATKGNAARTIDNKVATLRALFNFAIQQGHYTHKNPAEDRALQSKKQKAQGGYSIFEEEEVKALYGCEFMQKAKAADQDYFWTLALGLVTGCRISEITGLQKSQVKKDKKGEPFIRVTDAKTQAGQRDIPIPSALMASGLQKFLDTRSTDQVFKYTLRLGKGSGNAVGKKFTRHLEEAKVKRDKLVFHSLRKFFNNQLLNSDVPIEIRCQLVGHELDNVNVQSYTNKLTVEQMREKIADVQQNLLIMGNLINERSRKA